MPRNVRIAGRCLAATTVALALFAGVGAGASVRAAPISLPVSLELAPGTNLTGSWTVNGVGGPVTASTPVTASGAIHVALTNDFDDPGNLPLVLEVTDFDVLLDNFEIDLDVGPFGTIHIGVTGMHLAGFGPAAAVFIASPGNPGMGQFDLQGTTIQIDSGIITATGTGLISVGFPEPEVHDYAEQPFATTLPIGSTVKVLEEAVGPGQRNVTVILPLDVTQTFVTETGSAFSLSGQIVATGLKVVPEPSSALLVLAALAMLAGLARRRMKIDPQRKRS